MSEEEALLGNKVPLKEQNDSLDDGLNARESEVSEDFDDESKDQENENKKLTYHDWFVLFVEGSISAFLCWILLTIIFMGVFLLLVDSLCDVGTSFSNLFDCFLGFIILHPAHIVNIIFSILWFIARHTCDYPKHHPLQFHQKFFWALKGIFLLLCLVGVQLTNLDLNFTHPLPVTGYALANLAWIFNFAVCIQNFRDRSPHPSFVRFFWLEYSISSLVLLYNVFILRSKTDLISEIIQIAFSLVNMIVAVFGVFGKINPSFETNASAKSKTEQHLVDLCKKEWKLLLLGFFVASSQGAGYILSLYFTGSIITNQDSVEVTHFLILFSSFATFSSVFKGFQDNIFGLVKERFILWNKRELLKSLLKQDTQYIKNEDSSRFQKAINDCDFIGAFADDISIALNATGKIVASVVLLYIISWKLTTLLVLVITIVMCFITWKTFWYSAKQSILYQNVQRKVVWKASEITKAIQTIRWYNRVQYENEKFKAKLDESYKIGARRTKVEAFFVILEYLAYAVTSTSGLYYGAHLVNNHEINIAQFLSFSFISPALMDAVWEFIRTVKKFGDLRGSIANILNILTREPNEFTDGEKDLSGDAFHNPLHIVERDSGIVRFKNVTVETSDGLYRLKNFSFSIKRGEIVALVGASGSGKSTCISLLLREILATQGVVRILGNDVRDLDLSSLYRFITVVPQDSVIFQDTIDSNLAYGNSDFPKTNTRELMEIMTGTGVDEIKERKRNRVKGLSGGEKQKVALVRALFRVPEPSLFILDEFTSALDAESQATIVELVKNYVKRRGIACLMVSHRLQTTQYADKVVVLQPAGNIKNSVQSSLVEEGNPEDLKAAKGLYYQLLEMDSPK